MHNGDILLAHLPSLSCLCHRLRRAGQPNCKVDLPADVPCIRDMLFQPKVRNDQSAGGGRHVGVQHTSAIHQRAGQILRKHKKTTWSAEPSETLPTWRPHSLPAASSHHHRPSRSCWLGSTGRVQGWQPMDTYPLLCSSFTGTSWISTTMKHQAEKLLQIQSCKSKSSAWLHQDSWT